MNDEDTGRYYHNYGNDNSIDVKFSVYDDHVSYSVAIGTHDINVVNAIIQAMEEVNDD